MLVIGWPEGFTNSLRYAKVTLLFTLPRNMKATLFILSALALAVPALALPVPPRLAVDNGLMVNVPNLGYSRIETVTFCLEEAGVGKYQDLQTDSHFDYFQTCMMEHT